MLRASKSTPERNATRTLMTGLIVGLLILFTFDPIRRLFEHHVLERP